MASTTRQRATRFLALIMVGGLWLCAASCDDSGDDDDDDDGAGGSNSGLIGCPSQSQSVNGSCFFRMSDCSDGNVYKVECADASSPPYECSCQVNDSPTKTFTGDYCSLDVGEKRATLISECGWPLEDSG